MFSQLALGDFRAQLRVQLFRRFREFMLAQPGDQQRLVYRSGVVTETSTLRQLDNHSFGTFVRIQRRPHRIQPRLQSGVGGVLLHVGCGFSSMINPIQNRHAAASVLHDFGEGFPEEFLFGFPQ